MPRPARLEFLKHGKALCQKVFRDFVETFNWTVRVADNFKGDADCAGAVGQGFISVDRRDSDTPVIRLVNVHKLMGGSGEAVDRSCFKIVKIQQPDGEDYVKVMMTNCYFVAGSIPTFVPDIPPPGGDEEQHAEYEAYPWPEVPTSGEFVVFLSVRFQYDGSRSFVFYAWAAEDFFHDVIYLGTNEFRVPLYLFRDGKLAVDLRNAPRIQAWEIQEETRQ